MNLLNRLPITQVQTNHERKFGFVSTPFSTKFLRFVFLGGFTWSFAFSQMYLYTQILSMAYGRAYAITQVCIIFLNFILARHWIFYSIEENPFTQGAKFVVAVFMFRFFDWCLFILFNNYIGIRYYIAIFLAMSLVFPFKYLTYKIGVFSDR